jgi:hypothetical protein
MKKKIVIFGILFVNQALFAYEISLPQLHTKIEASSGWKKIAESKTHALIKGKSHNGVESTVIILTTDLMPKNIDADVMRLQSGDYIATKAKQITAEDGVLLATEPYLTNYKENKEIKGAIYFGTGLRYQLGLHHYSERAFFVRCPTKVLVVKTLTEARAPASEAINFVRGLQCK